MEQKGSFIVLEGSDGAGKGTQFNLLKERLIAAGYEVEVFDFPRYEEPSSHFVKEYLNGNYGSSDTVSPYTASLFYALDRYDAAPEIRRALRDGKVVLSNRYVGSNMAHQGSKFASDAERRGFFVWEDGLEYSLLGIPRPTINIFLKVPANVSYELILKKKPRTYTKNKRDIHEADLNHLSKTVDVFESLCKLFPKDFVEIECVKDSQLMSIPAISNLIWESVRPLLPAKNPATGKKSVINIKDIIASKEKTSTEQQENNLVLRNVSLLTALDFQLKTGQLSSNSLFDIKTTPKLYSLPRLSRHLGNKYKGVMNKVLELQTELSVKLHNKTSPENDYGDADIQHAIKLLYPLASLVSLEFKDKSLDIQKLRGYLGNSAEENWLLKQIKLSTKIASVEDSFELSGKSVALEIIDELRLNQASGYESEVKLISATPRNELDLLPQYLFKYADLSLDELKNHTLEIPFQDRAKSLSRLLVSNESAKIASDVFYTWDILLDTATIDALLRTIPTVNISAQVPTARYGYKMPELVEDTNLEASYLDAFDLCLSLHSDFLRASEIDLAPYTLLAGHKRRWQLSMTAKNLFGVDVDQLESSELKKFVEQLHQTAAEAHPLLSEILFRKIRKAKAKKTMIMKPSNRKRRPAKRRE